MLPEYKPRGESGRLLLGFVQVCDAAAATPSLPGTFSQIPMVL